MQMLFRVTVILCVIFTGNAQANLCKSIRDTQTKPETQQEIKIYEQMFPEQKWFGSQRYNAFVLECNRKRDANGAKLRKLLTGKGSKDAIRLLNRDDLEPKLLKFRYRFFGVAPFKMRYVVWKDDGVWQVLLPYRYSINESVKNRIDLNRDHASRLYDGSQVTKSTVKGELKYKLKKNAKSVWETQCSGEPIYVKGKKKPYRNKNGSNANKRGRKNKLIDRGQIQYRYKNDKNATLGCRVVRNKKLYGKHPISNKFGPIRPDHWLLHNFVKVGEKHWNQDGGFRLHIALKGFNETLLPKRAREVLKKTLKRKDDYLKIVFGSLFMPYGGNQMYKSNLWQPNNLSTMTSNGTHVHEIGHALGLDDEYGKGKGDCDHIQYQRVAEDENKHRSGGRTYALKNYTMCKGYGRQFNTIYHYIATSRYALGALSKK